jgi:murein L,D-transpeptidase YafK
MARCCGLALLLALITCGVAPAASVEPEAAAPEEAPTPAGPGCPATVDTLSLGGLTTVEALKGPALMVVEKEARRIGLYRQGALVTLSGAPACWPVALGITDAGVYPPGPKVRQGDRRTPEGLYATSDKPWSSFKNAIAVHYPNAADAAAGLRSGLITQAQHDAIVAAVKAGKKPSQETRLGGEILVHGGGSAADWTWGCVALDDAALITLRAALPAGMVAEVLILP